MHSKNNNKSQTFIQGLRPFSSSIPKNLKKHLKKGAYNYSNIIDNWTKIVSKKISDVSYPIKIKVDKNMKNGTLVLNIMHGKEMEIEYKKNEIIDRINLFFGYDCISNITLKIAQDKITQKNKNFPRINNLSEIENKIQIIKNEQLKSSLKNLVKAYNDRDK